MSLSRGRPVAAGAGEAFVSDIFNEVDEEVRREQLKKLWERYGILDHRARGAVRRRGRRLARLSMVGGQEGGRGRRRLRGRGDARASRASTRRRRPPSPRSPADGTAGYRDAGEAARGGRARAARSQGRGRDLRRARRRSQPRPDAATSPPLRAAYLLVDTAPLRRDCKTRLEPLTAADRPFRHSARALLALAAWRANDAAELRRWSDMVAGRCRNAGRHRAARSRC